ncbi:MAG TPA: hypothetical protein VMO26_01985 [Vicinamibacterales bacterium]|nr:hypothetical protein [Vicinamibacterales bacterium]
MLTFVSTWPLGDLRQSQLPDHDDALFSVWRLAWVAHQLTVDPSTLFDANIFWPEPNTLAYSDAMLLLGVAGAPLIWLGVHPVTVHNVLLLMGFLTAAVAAASLMRYFTPSRPAQLVAGTIFAFAPYRIAHAGHLELLWTAFLPLSLLCLYRVLESPTRRRGLTLGLTLGLQALCSVYYFVFVAIWLVPAALLAPLHVRIQWSYRHLVAGVLAVITAALLLAPYIGPYSRAREELPSRTERELATYSAVPMDYLRLPAGNRVYAAFESESSDERSLFMGIIALTLAVTAVVLSRTRDAIALSLLALVAAELSLGVNGVSYDFLRAAVPPLGGFRAPARFGVLVLLAVAVLAGLGLAHLLSGKTSRRTRLLTTAVIVGLTLEYWSAPLASRTQPTSPPPVYAWLAGEPPSVVLELPVPTPETLWLYETSHQYHSIYHWQRLVNGYSGYAPASYGRLLRTLRDFPSDASMAFLRDRKIDIVIFHRRYLDADEFTRLFIACKNPEWFTEMVTFPLPHGWGSVACRIGR